jgi:deoxyribodipyrimidine photo-lyase
MRSIWWIRRDIRLTDNKALIEALKNSTEVIPVYILDKLLMNKLEQESKKKTFLFDNLSTLDTELRKNGSRLIVRTGKPIDELVYLTNELNADRIYATDDHTPYSTIRDSRIQRDLPLELIDSPSIFHPASILKSDGTPYTVFTPYSKIWKIKAQGLIPDISHPAVPCHTISDSVFSIELTRQEKIDHEFLPGEINAQARLKQFTECHANRNAPIYSYKETRNRMDVDQTSKLSPYIRFGILSPRQLFLSAINAINNSQNELEKQNAEIWLNELIWRDFYIQILYHFPETSVSNFKRIKINWINNEDDLFSWQKGRTGYPIVDAGIRQLIQSGWIHNRARMIVASFLTKDLLIDWKYGDKFFMNHLIDGDPAANHGGWQWVAGTGTDASPYFRIFNPVIQGKKFDPDGLYIRKWIPELLNVPDQYIHEPWLMPIYEQKNHNCMIGIDYPTPIIDHHFARERALNAYGSS